MCLFKKVFSQKKIVSSNKWVCASLRGKNPPPYQPPDHGTQALMLCLNFPGSAPSSFPHSRHPGCLLFTKPGPSSALAFILEKSSRYASGISLFLVPFSSQHRGPPWPPHLETSMLFYVYFSPLHFIFLPSSEMPDIYVCLWSASLVTGLGASLAENSLHLPPSLSAGPGKCSLPVCWPSSLAFVLTVGDLLPRQQQGLGTFAPICHHLQETVVSDTCSSFLCE